MSDQESQCGVGPPGSHPNFATSSCVTSVKLIPFSELHFSVLHSPSLLTTLTANIF